MPELSKYDVVVVGAGIAGSALAASLSGHGLDIALIEAQPLAGRELPEPDGLTSFDPRVSALTPQSSAQLQALDCWQPVLDYRACAYQHMTVWDAEGTGEINFDSAEVGADVLGHIVENRAVVKALAQRLLDARDITLYNPAKLASVERDEDDSGMTVTLEDAAVLHAPLVVAADGALSPVRTLLSFQTREWDYGHHAVVCTVQAEQPHEHTAWQRFTPDGPLAFLPLAAAEGHYCSIVWSLKEEVASEMAALDDEAFCTALAEAFEQRLGRVLAASPRFAFPLRQRHAVDYVQPGVALVADAAHTIHPLAGQGINLGLADVAVLAEELLAQAKAGGDLGAIEVLRRYQRRRKGENLLMMAAMDGFKRLFEQEALPLRWLRNAGMRQVARMGPVKQQLMKHAMGL